MTQTVECLEWREIESTSRGELGTLAGAAVIVSVLGAEWGASVGEAACSSCCATKVLGVNAVGVQS